MKNWLIVMIAVITINCGDGLIAQDWDIGITGNVGLSKLTYPNEDFAVSGNFGLFLEKNMNTNSSLGFEVLFVQCESKSRLETTSGVALTSFHSSYFGIPLYYRYNFGKFGIKFGLQSLIHISAAGFDRFEGILNNEPVMSENHYDDINLNNVDVGPKIGVYFEIDERCSIRLDYYHGMRNAFSNLPLERNNIQVSLGINYRLNSRSI